MVFRHTVLWTGWIWVLTMLCPGHLHARTRQIYSMNPDWQVLVGDVKAHVPDFDDSQWKRVSLPYAWNEDDAFRLDIRELPTGIVWYRKRLPFPGQ